MVMVDSSSSFEDVLISLIPELVNAVGKEKQTMSIVGDDMDVCDVYRSFGSYVRLQVKDSQDHRGTLNILCSFEI